MPAEMKAAHPRLSVVPYSAPGARESLAAEVRAGLTARPKTLPPKYFYDELGSYLFEAICHLPEYYLTRAETAILKQYASAMVNRLPGPVSLVELGSGSAVKTRYLIEALLARQPRLHYQPIDISATMLEQSARELFRDYPQLQITAQASDYTEGLGQIERRKGESILALFLGSNIGNYDPPKAVALLGEIRRALRRGDGLLLGADLKKSAAVLEAAYDDVLGVTAAFNLNLLVRLNRELNADFDLSRFEHRAVYNRELSRVEMHLVSRAAQTIHLRAIGLTVKFREGETIHTESSYKYDHLRLAELAEATGFRHNATWLDAQEQFSCNLWMAAD